MREAQTSDLIGLDRSIRKAKELLSETPDATIDVRVGAQHEAILFTRIEFEELIEPEVLRAVELTATTFRSANVHSPNDLRTIYLTGGSSQIPLVHRHLQNLARVVAPDDLKTVVAQGAIFAERVARRMPQPHLPRPAIAAPELRAGPGHPPYVDVPQPEPPAHNWNGPLPPPQAPHAQANRKRTGVIITLSIVAALLVCLLVGAVAVFLVWRNVSGDRTTAQQAPRSLPAAATTSTTTATTATVPAYPTAAPMDRDSINRAFASYMNGLRDQNMPEFRAATCPRLRPTLLGFYLDGQHLVSRWTMLPYDVPSSSGTDNVVTVQATVAYRDANGIPAGNSPIPGMLSATTAPTTSVAGSTTRTER